MPVNSPPPTMDTTPNLGRALNGSRLGFGYGLENITPTQNHFVFGIDSLTAGGGNIVVTSFLDYFIAQIKAAKGDGGPGYQGLDASIATIEGVSFGITLNGGNTQLYLSQLIDADNVTLKGNSQYSFNRSGLEWNTNIIPLVFTGGTPTVAAIGFAVLSGGVVQSAFIPSGLGGSGYGSTPTISVGNSGTGATFTATVTGGVVTSVAVNAGGSGYSGNPAGAESITWNPQRNWDTAKIFYLIQPGGGSFRVYNKNHVSQGSTIQTAGTLALGSIELKAQKNTSQDPSIWFDQIGNTAGPVCIFGIFFQAANSGVMCTMAAKGGQTLQSYSNLNAAFQTTWWSNYSASANTGGIGPATYFIEGGTNDRQTAGITSSILQTALVTVINNCQTNANCNTVVCRPCDMSPSDTYYATFASFFGVYAAVAQNLNSAYTTRHSGYISDYDILGPYSDANNQGLIQSDHVHPSQLGNRKRAGVRLIYLGLTPSVGYISPALVTNITHTQNADPYNSMGGTWNGNHLILGTQHLWIDANGRLRTKNAVPASDQDGWPAIIDAGMNVITSAFYRLQDTGWRDWSTNKNDLTASGTPPTNAAGGPGLLTNYTAFASASSEQLSIADNSTIKLGATANTTDWTALGWVYLTDKAALYAIAAKWDASGKFEWRLIYDNAGDKFRFDVGNGAKTSSTSVSCAQIGGAGAGSPTAATWYFVVARFNSLTDTASIRAYTTTARGADSTANPSLLNGTGVGGTASLRIGTDGTGTNFLNGRVAQFCLFITPIGGGGYLTEAQITRLWNDGYGVLSP